MAVVGSSLGGFYATVVAERTGCRAVLLNPAVDPARDLARYIGEQTPFHDPDEHFVFRAEYVDELRALTPRRDHAARALPRRHRQGRRGARLARDERRATPARTIAPARRQRPCAVGLRRAPADASLRLPRPGLSAAEPAAGTRRTPSATIARLCLHCSKTPASSMAGRVMSEADSSLQVELDSGKRVKVKAANVLLRFDEARAGRADRARRRRWRATIDLDLAWEFAPEDEFGFADLARDYFDAKAGAEQQAAALFAPVRGAALLPPRSARASSRRRPKRPSRPRCWASSARSSWRRRSTPGPANWSRATARRRCASSSTRSCSSPTRTRPNTRPWSRPRARAQRAPLDLLQAAGAIDSPYQFHWRRFLFENFPKGTGFPGAAGAADQGRAAAGRRAGLLDRRLGHHRDRRCAVGAGPGQRHGGARHPHRRAGPGDRARLARSTRWRASACPPSTCRATS